jgi:YVTN family beta-propeller protein
MTSRAEALFARYVEHLVVEGRALSVDELAAGDEAVRASLLALLDDFRAVEEALDRPSAPLEGTTLGRYRVLGRLGAGGMGEVFRARDERLGREVALKVLPPLFAFDPQRRARFEREARLLAAVSHPNVEAIYGIEASPGRTWLVLELLAGETLAERLKRGPLPGPRALRLLDDVAAGLQAAHARGIVHRDLKPANIQIMADGHAKVLDFSLGKLCGAGGPGGAPPTVTRRAPTITGTILGTASYMSPEQARGRDTDERTDVWSFGCVLFEALSGRRAFPGDTFTDAVARVIHYEPDWRAVPPGTPAGVRRLIRRCLEKDPQQRPGSMGPVRAALAEALRARPPRPWGRLSITVLAVLSSLASLSPPRSERGRLSAEGVPGPVPRGAAPPSPGDLEAYRSSLAAAYSRWLESGGGRGAARAEASLAYVTISDPPLVQVVSPHSMAVVASITVPATGSDLGHLSLTPDGTRAYFTGGMGDDKVFVLDTPSRSLLRVPDGGGIRVPGCGGIVALTPDGARAYVSQRSGEVAVLDTEPTSATYHHRLDVREGGTLRVPARPGSPAVSPDGTRLYVGASSDDPLSVFDVDPRSPTFHRSVPLPDDATLTGRGPHGYLGFRRDGTRLFVTASAAHEVRVVDVQPGSPTFHRVLARVATPSYPTFVASTPEGSLAYVVGLESSTVLALDAASGSRVFPPIEVGAVPTTIAFLPDGTRALVSNLHSRTLSVIDTDPRSTTFHKVVATIPTRGFPNSVVVGEAPRDDEPPRARERR